MKKKLRRGLLILSAVFAFYFSGGGGSLEASADTLPSPEGLPDSGISVDCENQTLTVTESQEWLDETAEDGKKMHKRDLEILFGAAALKKTRYSGGYIKEYFEKDS